MRRVRTVLIVWVGSLLAAAAALALVNQHVNPLDGRLSDPQAPTAAPAPRHLTDVGDCGRSRPEGGLDPVPCRTLHDIEIFAVLPAPDRPGPHDGENSEDAADAADRLEEALGRCDSALGELDLTDPDVEVLVGASTVDGTLVCSAVTGERYGSLFTLPPGADQGAAATTIVTSPLE